MAEYTFRISLAKVHNCAFSAFVIVKENDFINYARNKLRKDV